MAGHSEFSIAMCCRMNLAQEIMPHTAKNTGRNKISIAARNTGHNAVTAMVI